jgi:bifunctional NMN adenylyltransferase/nudix hydrolase
MIQRTYGLYDHQQGEFSCQYDVDNSLVILPLNDHTYNDNSWIEEVRELVDNETNENDKIGLIGCAKDHTSYYLKLFPTWGNESVEFLDPINATDLRELYWSYGAINPSWDPETGTHTAQNALNNFLSNDSLEFLKKFQKTETYTKLKTEQEFIEVYKKGVSKYPRIEHTVDAVVVQSGHILLVRRRSEPGKGIWALPGGFIHEYEKLEDAAIRELKEETKLKVPEAVLRGSIKESKTYDDPHRSARGRLITQAFLISLPAQTSLPKVRGSDDADKAKWVPLNELNPKKMFEDHYFIVKDMLGV